MRIRAVEAFALRAPLDDGPYWGAASWGDDAPAPEREADLPAHRRLVPAYSSTCDTLLVRIRTDTGHAGWGEGKAPVAPEIARDVVDRLLTPVLIGADPREIEPLWDGMLGRMRLRNHYGGFLLEAISAIDIALWDLAGQAVGAPVAQLLGGAYRDAIPVYASGVPGMRSAGERPVRMARAAVALAEAGYVGVKLALGHGVEADRASLRAAREALPPGFALLADAAASYDLGQGLRLLHAVEEADVRLLEAPLAAEDRAGYAALARASRVPIGIDVVASAPQFLDVLRDGAAHVVQPDVSRSGGFTEARRISALARAFGATVVPHMSLGSVVHVAACAHYAASLPQLPFMEFWTGRSALNSTAIGSSLVPEGGLLRVPRGPGLGLELDEDALLAYAVETPRQAVDVPR